MSMLRLPIILAAVLSVVACSDRDESVAAFDNDATKAFIETYGTPDNQPAAMGSGESIVELRTSRMLIYRKAAGELCLITARGEITGGKSTENELLIKYTYKSAKTSLETLTCPTGDQDCFRAQVDCQRRKERLAEFFGVTSDVHVRKTPKDTTALSKFAPLGSKGD